MIVPKAVIAGGGISGLAAAIALTRVGWDVEVFEQAPELGEVGAGLTLWPNASRALDHIGLGDRIRDVGLLAGNGGIMTSRGDRLIHADTSELDRRYGPAVALHRADLLAALAKAVPDGVLRTGTLITGARLDGEGVVVSHSHGESRADLLVGADGHRSVIRARFWPGTDPIYFGATAWRTVIDRPGQRLEVVGEFFGQGEEFGLIQLPKDQVYAFAGTLAPPGRRSPDGELAELRRRFGHWAAPIPQLLSEASPDKILRHDLSYVPKLKTYVHGPVVLIGDAAHAMTPNMGQGACQALEDAVTLGVVVQRGNLARYDSLRLRRTQSVSRMSRQAARLGLLTSPVMAAARDRLMKLVPASVMLRSFSRMYNWSPPCTTSSTWG
ncbi:FAD-dependent monooxygenase [Kibdelosporangium persicum]|uniref:FAD-dependent urate hydroxylase n=1 Tax=Kibdelosporangium persicum TaxID=2698649 RepID=A0ABX2F530_9PSEU|nr:FAD-dependent monooxygenase [Kibdelosporangium persicum]NRN66017.1 FAD-dependent urate hydroxylase [Kibdelosporangium persicum]